MYFAHLDFSCPALSVEQVELGVKREAMLRCRHLQVAYNYFYHQIYMYMCTVGFECTMCSLNMYLYRTSELHIFVNLLLTTQKNDLYYNNI